MNNVFLLLYSCYLHLVQISMPQLAQQLLYCSHLRFSFNSGDGGLLIHCISGWDRTPLFVSLLRMSLWAVSFSCCYDNKTK